MKIGAALREILLSDSTIQSALNDRIGPIVAGQKMQLPFCTYRVVSIDPINVMGAAAPINDIGVEYTIFTQDYDEVHAVLDQIRTVLDRYCGKSNGIEVQKCFYAGARDEFDKPGRMYAHTIFFTVRAKSLPVTNQQLVGMLTATANAVCTLLVRQYLAGTTNMSGNASATIQVTKKMAGTLAMYANASCAISIANGLAGVLNMSADTTLMLAITKQLAGAVSVSGNTSLTLIVRQTQLLAGVLNVSGTASAAITITKKLAGATTMSGNASCAVSVAAAPWAPTDLADLQHWWDASDTATITHSSGAVSQWDDKQGTNDFRQVSGSWQPTTNATTQNSLNVIDFNGDELEGSTITDFADAYVARTVYYVAKSNDTDFNIIVSAGTSVSRAWFFDTRSSPIRLQRGATNEFQDLDTQIASSAFHILGTVGNGTSDEGFRNGNSVGTATTWTQTAYSDGNTLIGRQANGAASGELNGSIAEIVICDAALGTSDRQKLEGYLAHKWGLTANLPSGHPYKSTAP